MKVLVTGAGGFIGSHLVESCVESGFEVKAFVHYNSNGKWGWLEGSPTKNDIEIILGDVRDYDSVFSATKSVDVIFHLAALVGIPFSYISPIAYIKTNIEGTYNILESAKQRKIEQVIVTSTSETYGTARYVPIDEKHPLSGQSPYAASKIGADQIALSYYTSYKLPVKVLRPFNTYGPRQSARAIIPAILIQLLSETKEVYLGNLSPTRDFTYVKDTVSAFIEVYKSDSLFGEITNVGMNEEISIEDLAELIMKIVNVRKSIDVEQNRVRRQGSEVERLRCDSSKLAQNTNWRPKFSLEQGLNLTTEWLKSNLRNYKAKIYNI